MQRRCEDVGIRVKTGLGSEPILFVICGLGQVVEPQISVSSLR